MSELEVAAITGLSVLAFKNAVDDSIVQRKEKKNL